MSEAGDSRAVRRTPHYAKTTVTQLAPEFANHEQDVIRQSFSTGNHTWIKEALPVELGPDTVNILRRQRMERNRLAEPIPQTWSKMTQLWGGGYYQEFEFIPDEYDRRLEASRRAAQEAAEKREKIANHEWRYTSQERRLKHEPLVNDPSNKEIYPYLPGGKDTEKVSRKCWLRVGLDAGHGGGGSQESEPVSFLAGRGRGLDDDSRNSRMTLPMIVQRLQTRIDQDWEGTTVVVSATDQDLVQVAFHMATVDSERGVQAYMGVLAKDVDLLGPLGLRKVSQLWGVRRDFAEEDESAENSWIFFLFMPKWVRMRPTDAYYTVHPRSRGSAFQMSAAGSSVLLSLGSASTAEQLSAGPSVQSARGGRGQDVGQNGKSKMDVALLLKAVNTLPSIQESRRGPATAR